ncbi:hypothetical protein LUW77_24290 [Streptomyces radiopugnans]|nr:hypothetical protein LUW77_24290 [Streptomyces radiopugnans]
MAQVLDDGGGADQHSADGAEALRQRPGDQVHLADQPEVLAHTASAGAQQADVVGAVHHQPGAVAPGQFHDARQRAQVALHGEHAVGDDQPAAAGLGGGQQTAEMPEVAVAVAVVGGAAQPYGVHQRGVVGHVGEDGVAFVQQGGEREVGLEAGGGHQRGLAADERGQPSPPVPRGARACR